MTEHLSLASTDGVKPGAPPARDIRLIAVDLDMTLVDWAVHGPHVDPKAIEAFTAADTRGVLCGIASPNTVQLGHLVAFLRRFCEGRERNGARRWFPPASG